MLNSQQINQALKLATYTTLAVQSKVNEADAEFFPAYENAKEEPTRIPLMMALNDRLLELNIPLKDLDAKRIIERAIKKKDREMLSLIAKSSHLLSDENRTILITFLVSKGMRELAQEAANSGSYLPSKTIKHAVESSDISELSRAIAHGSSITPEDFSKNTLMHVAAQNLDLAMMKVILKNQLGSAITPNSQNFSPVQTAMRSALSQLEGKSDKEKDAVMQKAKECIEYLQRNGAGYLLVQDDKYFPSQNIASALKNAFKDYINSTTITFAGFLLLSTTAIVMVQLLPFGIIINTALIGLTTLIGFTLLLSKAYNDAKNPVKDSVENMLTNLSVNAYKIDLDKNVAIGTHLTDYAGNVVSAKEIKDITTSHPAFKNASSGIYSTENLPVNEHGGLNLNFKRQQAMLKSMVTRFKELQKELSTANGNSQKEEKLYSMMAEVAHAYDLVQIGLEVKDLNAQLNKAFKPENTLALVYELRTNKEFKKEFEALAERIRSGKIKVPLHTRLCFDEVSRLVKASAKDGVSYKQDMNFNAKEALNNVFSGIYQGELSLTQVLEFSDEFRVFAKDKITETKNIREVISDFAKGAKEGAGNIIRNAADFVAGAAGVSRADVIEKVAGAAGAVAGAGNAVAVGYAQVTSNPITQAIMFIGGLASCIIANKFLIVKALDHAKYSALSSITGVFSSNKVEITSIEDFAKTKIKAQVEQEEKVEKAEQPVVAA